MNQVEVQPPRLANWNDFSQHRASAMALLASNALPLLGVILWGWSTFAIVVIYWAENVVIGAINVLKMLTNVGSSNSAAGFTTNAAAKAFLVPFFCVHYGIFCLVHGVFVFVLVGDEHGGFGGPFGNWGSRFDVLFQSGAIWAILGLAISHLYSFARNYLGEGENRTTPLTDLMGQPYGRIVVLHLAILFGAFATVALGSPVWVLVILILGKTALDLAFHLRQHRNGANKTDNKTQGNEGFGAGGS